MKKRPLFDVLLEMYVNEETGTGVGFYDVSVIDRYNENGKIVGYKTELVGVDDAMEFAREAVSDFLRETRA